VGGVGGVEHVGHRGQPRGAGGVLQPGACTDPLSC